ncbi:hypothetical protein [Neorhodopirellula pilleata]|uniref:Uncharacterized protein n=1 Tax=Neorhodopirellula pilleata TaxID=2714738 RepID=A0A5C5ZP77_9BACT|nr:hypothetical protein [Neorhodopirellula pilleata]TWT89312.1 hypothetical protein Pla100_56290 [Neorhodopirellula pilleata]
MTIKRVTPTGLSQTAKSPETIAHDQAAVSPAVSLASEAERIKAAILEALASLTDRQRLIVLTYAQELAAEAAKSAEVSR